MANRLANATSPYLLQHKDNPVDWWEWSPEAFAEAKRLDRPVLLSVGYAACHWCHVDDLRVSESDARTKPLVRGTFRAAWVQRGPPLDTDSAASCITLVYHRPRRWTIVQAVVARFAEAVGNRPTACWTNASMCRPIWQQAAAKSVTHGR